MKRLLTTLLAVLQCACASDPGMTRIPDYPTVTELARMLTDGETTSEAIVTEFLARAENAAHLNVFITLDATGALSRARELDQLRRQGTTLGPLHGIPMVIKDNIHVAGLPNTAGTPALAGFVPGRDAPTVAALVDAGAIVLGKTNLHELAFGITSINGAYGAVGNPFDPSRFAGGSSGGTASAVSAGLVPAGLGTDTGGSVRIPAALTGVAGFRPSTGRYDSAAVTPISHTRDTVGIIARTVADVILLDDVLGDDDSTFQPVPGDIRLGIARDYYFSDTDVQVVPVVDSALDKLRAAGVTLVDIELSGLADLAAESSFPIALYETVTDLTGYLERYATGQTFESVARATASEDVSGLFLSLLTGEIDIPEDAYTAALSARERMRAMFRELFATYELDAVIFPTTPLPARPIEGSVETVSLNGARVATFQTYIRNTDPASIAALPGISLPIGLTRDGLPVGMELDGPERSDRRLLGIAAMLEDLFQFSSRP